MGQDLDSYIGFVYMWTNNIDGKKYIGLHFGKVDDGYIGSGFYFKRAIEKYGITNFSRMILHFEYNSRLGLYKAEFDIINRYNAVFSDEFYNLTNMDPKNKGAKEGAISRIRSEESIKKQAITLTGRKLSQEHKESLKRNNGTTGKRYYNNGELEGRFNTGCEPSSWVPGRLPSRLPSTKGMRHYTDGTDEGLFLDGEQPQGWYLGRPERQKFFGSKNHFYGKKHSKETINRIKESIRENSKKEQDRG